MKRNAKTWSENNRSGDPRWEKFKKIIIIITTFLCLALSSLETEAFSFMMAIKNSRSDGGENIEKELYEEEE